MSRAVTLVVTAGHSPSTKPLATRPARRPHRCDRRLAPEGGRERAPDPPGDLRLAPPRSPIPFAQQHEHGAAPSGTGEPRAQGARPSRGGDHQVELRRAALIEPPTRFVRLVQQLAEPPHLTACQQLRAEPGARRLNAFAAATVRAAEEASPAPTGTSLATATRAPAPAGAAPTVSSSRITPARYALHPVARPSRQSMRARSPSSVEISSSTPASAGPTATVVRGGVATGSTGPPL